MLHSDYPTPPQSENDTMDRGNRLPPITTHLTEFFPKGKPSTPPVSPEDPRQSQVPTLKRKRSQSREDSRDSRAEQHKRLAIESGAGLPSQGPAYDQVGLPVVGILEPVRAPVHSPAVTALGPSLFRSPPRQPVQAHVEHATPAANSQAGSPPSNGGSNEVRFRIPSYGETSNTHASPETAYATQPPTQTHGRDLPPLMTPQSPRSHVDRKFENVFPSGLAKNLPPMEPALVDQSSTSKYTYPARLERSAPDTTLRPYFSPGKASDTTPNVYSRLPAPQPRPQSVEAGRAPYSFDPVRAQLNEPYSIHGPRNERRALPPVPGLADHIPPYSVVSSSTSATSLSAVRTSPPIPSSDRYRFDPSPAVDHPARRRRGNLPKEATARLNQWFAEHALYPYPKEEEKQRLQEQTGLTMSQIGNWFINARRRRRPSTTSRGAEQQPSQHPQGLPLAYSQSTPLPPQLSQPSGLPPYYTPQERLPYPRPPFDFKSNRLPPYQGPPGR